MNYDVKKWTAGNFENLCILIVTLFYFFYLKALDIAEGESITHLYSCRQKK